jgi:hypothetical protein
MNSVKYWIAIAAAATLTLASEAGASGFGPSFGFSAVAPGYDGTNFLERSGSVTHIVPRGETTQNRFIKGSDTANFFYRVGVSKFEKGELAEAERAFKAVLRASGSKKEAHHYLALISHHKGDEPGVVKHVAAYKSAR